MPLRHLHLAAPDRIPDELRTSMTELREQLEIPGDFAPEVVAAAEQAATAPRLPDLDCTDVAFLTVDPPGAMDLDQAMHLSRVEGGYRVRYAIADVAAFVTAGDPVDVEAHARVQTLYAPDQRVPLHPPQLSEAAASLLPGETRPAFVWTIDLDATGATTEVDVRRARVRSVVRLDYATVQQVIDGQAPMPAEIADGNETLTLLKTIGQLRQERERERGGVSLQTPDQEVVTSDRGWSLEFRDTLDCEEWNAQISLLTGIGAAQLMLGAKVGILRTLPEADERSVKRLRATARALGLDWPRSVPYPDFVRGLHPDVPAESAMLAACTQLFRGAGYAAFDGELPDHPEQSALRSAYAHVTAPLRRLVDRYGLEVCAAVCAGDPVPDWVLAGIGELPELMRTGDAKARKYERGIVDLVEAGLLRDAVGSEFEGVVTDLNDRDPRAGIVMVREPAVEAKVTAPGDGDLPLGDEVTVRLVSADVANRKVEFELVAPEHHTD